jgi:hypothetical protein
VRTELSERPELAELRRRLERTGLLLSAPAVTKGRRGVLLLWLAVLGLGGLRLAADIDRGRPVTVLVLLLVAALLGALVSLRFGWRRTAAGHQALRAARRGSGGRALAASTGAARYGPVGAGYGVALFGLSALWATDPAYAGVIGAPRLATGGSAPRGGVVRDGVVLGGAARTDTGCESTIGSHGCGGCGGDGDGDGCDGCGGGEA